MTTKTVLVSALWLSLAWLPLSPLPAMAQPGASPPADGAADEPRAFGSKRVPRPSTARAFAQAGAGPQARTVSAGLLWDWRDPSPTRLHGAWSVHVEGTAAHWWLKQKQDGFQNEVFQIGVTPSLRWWFAGDRRWFADAGIGLNYFTPHFRTADRRFGSKFNFGDHVGVGWRGQDGNWEWGLRFQHFSNAGIQRPNPGEDIVHLRVAVAL